MIVSTTSEIKSQPIFYRAKNFISDSDVYLKLEGLNIAESIKLRTAKYLISGLERERKLIKGVSKVL